MEVAIDSQLRLLAAALLLGMALALLYDLLRALRARRERPGLTGALDAAYCAALALSLCVFTLRVGGGELRLYALAAAGVGAALYFGVFSPLLRPLWGFWAGTFFELARLLRLPGKTLKKFHRNLHKIMKRDFLFLRRSLIIRTYRRYALHARRAAGGRGSARCGGKGKKTNRHIRFGARPADDLRGGHAPDGHARKARQRAGGAGDAHRARRKGAAGEPLA
ncbi:MAG: hypothetical protein E7425_13455 [Ruminococcaceae bacterium]|nr:hypothetical protein [Oscillospiraceae bacterium]